MASKKNGAGAKPVAETMKRLCEVQLSETERVNRGDEMADCEVKIESLKAERSELARQVKSLEKRRNELGHALDTGAEERELLCTWEPDYNKNVFRLRRPDNGAEVDTRPMSAHDLNVDLFPAGDVKLPPPPRVPGKRGRPRKTDHLDPDHRPAA